MRRWWIYLISSLVIADTFAFYWLWLRWREQSQDEVVLAAASLYNVDPALVKAVVWRESRFDPKANGKAGEIGLMQISAAAAQDWGEREKLKDFRQEQLYDPGTNTLVGAWYLRRLLERYAHTDNPAAYALADYNAGRNNVLRWNHGIAETNSAAFLRQIGFPSTRKYVTTVLERNARYRLAFAPQSQPD